MSVKCYFANASRLCASISLKKQPHRAGIIFLLIIPFSLKSALLVNHTTDGPYCITASGNSDPPLLKECDKEETPSLTLI